MSDSIYFCTFRTYLNSFFAIAFTMDFIIYFTKDFIMESLDNKLQNSYTVSKSIRNGD